MKKTEYLKEKKILTKLIWAHIWAQNIKGLMDDPLYRQAKGLLRSV